MKRVTFGLCTGAVLGVAGMASAGDLCETVVYCDDFDTYQPGILVGQDCVFETNCGNNGDCPANGSWQGWNGDPNAGQSLVVTDPNNSSPHSVKVDGADDLVRTYGDLGLTSGVYQYSVDMFIPDDYTGETYFILLNTYVSSGDQNWSTQVHFLDGNVLSDFDDGVQNEVSYVTGQWGTIRVIMNLDEPGGTSEGQQIYYNDELVVTKSWVDGVSGGGAQALGAVDLFANTGSSVYYDNIQICELSPLGACCFADSEGSCLDGQSTTECTDAGGVFQGFGSSCGGQCPVLGPDGWEVEAPITWDDSQGRNDTCDAGATCEDIYEGDDIQLAVTIPWPSNWTISTAGSELLDTELLIGNTGLCSADLVDDGGCVAGPSCSGDQDFEGNQAVFTLGLGEGDVINVNVEEFSGECGKVNLSVSGPCPDIVLPDGSDENEPCGEDTNGGCNSETPVFTPLAVGETMRGTSFLAEGGTSRDTDWFEMTLSPGDYTIYQYGEFGGTGVGGIIQYTEGMEGSGNCDDITGSISPFGTFNRCGDYPDQGEMEINFTITVEGTYWMFVGPAFGGADFDCADDPGKDYYLRVEEAGSECTEAPDGDVDFNGETNFDDLLLVLSKWGSDGSEGGDADCDGDVDFDDLLLVLSGWDS